MGRTRASRSRKLTDRTADRVGLHAYLWASPLAALLCLLLISPFGARADSVAAPPSRRLVILGDSLTASFGLDPSEGYPALLQKMIDSAELPYRVVNAGVSGDTTSGGIRRIDWVLKQPVDVFVLALGGNDGLRGMPPSLTRSNLLGILDKVAVRYPRATLVVAGMQMPPNMGLDYTRAFQELFPDVARKTSATLIPFLLEGVGGLPEMNQPDLIHPTAEGHVRIAKTVWTILRPLLKAAVSTDPVPRREVPGRGSTLPP